ncbi:hypothetical protein [Paraburkholderia humisilvae]|uniref:Uncharacterized protein n=1 Tax=Paraburkholderia humisilvae TaxID=627669 RepID=A0A6J5EFS0_9BURK|nr:hypothetical protein [Paraburkholderia humisilvae]CAB3764201.1 hypothetical protein LMG29542_04812 [Paraburkholderia humisilvae]
MSSVKAILQLIVDRPSITAAEIADELDMQAKNVQPLIHPYLNDGRVKSEKKPAVEGGASVNHYFASQTLLKEVDGVKQIVTRRKPALAPATVGDGRFSCGFFTDGRLSIVKDRKAIDLSREETTQLLAFIDAINIERIVGAA